jgi:hypothetical protein
LFELLVGKGFPENHGKGLPENHGKEFREIHGNQGNPGNHQLKPRVSRGDLWERVGGNSWEKVSGKSWEKVSGKSWERRLGKLPQTKRKIIKVRIKI